MSLERFSPMTTNGVRVPEVYIHWPWRDRQAMGNWHLLPECLLYKGCTKGEMAILSAQHPCPQPLWGIIHSSDSQALWMGRLLIFIIKKRKKKGKKGKKKNL